MYWRCDGCEYLVKNDNGDSVCDLCGLTADKICEQDCKMVEIILWFQTSPDYEYSVLMPTETVLLFCGFYETKEEAEAEAKKINGFVLRDMRHSRG